MNPRDLMLEIARERLEDAAVQFVHAVRTHAAVDAASKAVRPSDPGAMEIYGARDSASQAAARATHALHRAAEAMATAKAWRP